jgi:hypothetical protein
MAIGGDDLQVWRIAVNILNLSSQRFPTRGSPAACYKMLPRALCALLNAAVNLQVP